MATLQRPAQPTMKPPGALLRVDLSGVRPLMTGIYWAGWLIVLLSSLNIDLLELWGLRQAWSWARGEVYEPPPFKQSWLFRLVRHPIYLGLLIAFWATPWLTAGHALFAGCMSAYIFIGAWFEERDSCAGTANPTATISARCQAISPAIGVGLCRTRDARNLSHGRRGQEHEKHAIRGSAPPSGRRAAGQSGQAQGADARPRRAEACAGAPGSG